MTTHGFSALVTQAKMLTRCGWEPRDFIALISNNRNLFSSALACSVDDKIELDLKIDKHNAELQWNDPSTKVIGEFSTRGCIFPPNARNGF